MKLSNIIAILLVLCMVITIGIIPYNANPFYAGANTIRVFTNLCKPLTAIVMGTINSIEPYDMYYPKYFASLVIRIQAISLETNETFQIPVDVEGDYLVLEPLYGEPLAMSNEFVPVKVSEVTGNFLNLGLGDISDIKPIVQFRYYSVASYSLRMVTCVYIQHNGFEYRFEVLGVPVDLHNESELEENISRVEGLYQFSEVSE